MTKSLTEQFREESLKDGFYYVHIPNAICGVSILDEYELRSFIGVRDWYKIEVLADVPSYEEWKETKEELELHRRAIEQTDRIEKCLNQEGQIKRLEEQLRIATKALKKLTRDCNKWGIAREALKEIKEVK